MPQWRFKLLLTTLTLFKATTRQTEYKGQSFTCEEIAILPRLQISASPISSRLPPLVVLTHFTQVTHVVQPCRRVANL
jgi:hypothetical protein